MKKKQNNRAHKKSSESKKSSPGQRKVFTPLRDQKRRLPQSEQSLLTGKIKRHPDGFGFFLPDDPEHPDVYIPKHAMTGIMTGDRLTIKAYPEGRGDDRFRGDVVSILERGTKKIVGKFQSQASHGLVKDEGKGWGQDLYIPLADTLQAKSGDLVAAEILEYPDEGHSFTGKVIQVLGDINDPMNDIKRVIAAQNIPDEFPAEVLAQSKSYETVPTEKDFKNRKDLRQMPLITIDGATAKDFDDAILTEMTPQGFRLYVAIADVSHYVKPDTAIDDEAYMRGNSVYFPNFVVPMLPEVLSNGLCSLNPHVPRLCLVAEMEFDFQGQRKSSKFYEAVMDSKARMTYGEAQEIIDGADLIKPQVTQMAQVKDNILHSADLAKLLMIKRYKEGSLDLEIPETELLIDATGTPIDVIRSERLFSHRLIEEMMLAANVAVAEFLSNSEIPALYRIHDSPNPQALTVLEKYLTMFGGHIKLDAASLIDHTKKNSGEKKHSLHGSKALPPGRLQKKLTKALEEFKDKPEGQILHILTLRSMAQAKYATNNVGHFGLGFENYTHFTSPIRRYPDLIVHRLLKSQIISGYETMSEEDLASAGTMLSACEQKAAKSERQIKSIKKARFLQKFIGEEFDGIISSVTRFGVFVLLREYDVDGLIKIDDLSQASGTNERFIFDEENLRLVAKRSGFSFDIGARVKVQVVSADIELGQVNFMLVEKLESSAAHVPLAHSADQHSSKKNSGRKKNKPADRNRETHADVDPRKKSLRLKHLSPHTESVSKKPKDRFGSKTQNQFKTPELFQTANNSSVQKSSHQERARTEETPRSSSSSRRDQILKMLDEGIALRGNQSHAMSSKSGKVKPHRADKQTQQHENRRDAKGKDRAKNKHQSARSNFKKRR